MYKSLQMGRAFAAILVVLLHLGNTMALDKYFAMSEFALPFLFGGGVEFFFVLSGFIIFHVHKNDINQPQKIASYIKKRLTRIYPTYWIIFICVFLLALLSTELHVTVPHDPWTIVKSLLLVPQDRNLHNAWGTGAPVIGVAWTLQYEMLFYLFFALLIVNKWLGIISGTLLLFFSIYFSDNPAAFPLSFISNDYIFLFVMGMIVSLRLSSRKPVLNKPVFYLGFGIILFIITAINYLYDFNVLATHRTLSYGVASSFIILGLIQFENQGFIIGEHQFIQILGNASYALYLIHFPIISILCKLLVFLNVHDYGYAGVIISYFFIFSSCIFSAVTFHIMIEKVVIKWLRY